MKILWNTKQEWKYKEQEYSTCKVSESLGLRSRFPFCPEKKQLRKQRHCFPTSKIILIRIYKSCIGKILFRNINILLFNSISQVLIINERLENVTFSNISGRTGQRENWVDFPNRRYRIERTKITEKFAKFSQVSKNTPATQPQI